MSLANEIKLAVNNVIWDCESLENALKIELKHSITVSSCSIDSRTIEKGGMFIGIRGKNFNGNQFAALAFQKGVSCCILDEIPTNAEKFADKIILVNDTFKALNDLGKFARLRYKGKVIAITGSVGKTSTKEMLKLAFQGQGNVYASAGNFNNHYGLPLTLANMPIGTDFAILELGMSCSGELTALSNIAQPHISIITIIAPAHLEYFSSVASIATAKAEIFNGMEEGGVAIINYDCPYEKIMSDAAIDKKLKVIGFSETNPSDYQLTDYKKVADQSFLKLFCNNAELFYQIGASGKHQALNSTAVIAAIEACGADLNISLQKLATFQAHKGRGQVHKLSKRNITLIDDSYNAGPASVKAAIENISEYRKTDERIIIILGDMKELGNAEVQFHVDLARPLIEHFANRIYTVGDLMKNLYDILPDEIKGVHSSNSFELAEIINDHLNANDIILIKGSNSIKMDKIVDAIINF